MKAWVDRIKTAALAVTAFAAVSCASDVREMAAPQAIVDEIRAHTTNEQQAALADGRVTEAEYERAVLETAQCMRDNGAESTTFREGWRIRLQGPGVDSLDAAKDWGAINLRCFEQHSDDVEAVWMLQHQPSQQERDAARAALTVCLRAAGVPEPLASNPSGPGARDLRLAFAEAYTRCRAAAEPGSNLQR